MGDQNAKRPDQKPGRLSMDQGPTHILDVKSLAPSSPRVKDPMPDQTTRLAEAADRRREGIERDIRRGFGDGSKDATVSVNHADLTALLASHRRMKEAMEEIVAQRGDAHPGPLDFDEGVVAGLEIAAQLARQALQGDAHADR